MDLKETDILGEDINKHWYYCSKAKAMAKFLSPVKPLRTLDIGAGSGFFSRYLLENSSAKEAWCVDISYSRDSDSTSSEKPIYFRRDIGFLEADLVLLMDVLEHVEDDIGLLKNYIDKVPPGSHFLVSVPAFQFLWSGHDDFLEHKRRYTLPQIEDVLRAAGLSVQYSNYYFGGVFPIAAALRMVQKSGNSKGTQPQSQLKQHHSIINNFLKIICYSELPFMSLNRLAGLTVFCLAKKNNETCS